MSIINTSVFSIDFMNTPEDSEVFGNLKFHNNKFYTFNGSEWDEIIQHAPSVPELQPHEIEEVREFLMKKHKYDKILREHFPEDYL